MGQTNISTTTATKVARQPENITMRLRIDRCYAYFCASEIKECFALFSFLKDTNEGLSEKKLQRVPYEKIQNELI